MFGSKKCKNCGKKTKDEWKFCPQCGEEISNEFEARPFESIFNNIDDEFERIDKEISSDFFRFPRLDTKMPKGISWINIVISSGTGREPKIEVKTSGGYKHLEPEIKRKLGIKQAIKDVEEKPRQKQAKVTEEPETEIKTVGGKQVIQIKLPETKNIGDIEVRKLEQSIEIKAFTKNKTYFKLIPIPLNSNILSKEFQNNILRIEIGR